MKDTKVEKLQEPLERSQIKWFGHSDNERDDDKIRWTGILSAIREQDAW